MAPSTITFLVLAGAVVLFVTNRVPVAIVAIGVALSLWATGVLDLPTATAGFGDPTILFIASTFVVAEALDSTGVTAWIGQRLMSNAGAGTQRVLGMAMVVCAVLAAMITPNAAVPALIPAVVLIALRTGEPSSQLLMPLAFAAHAGSLLALTGTPVNVLIGDAASDAGAGSLNFFSFALVGVPLLVGTVAIVLTIGPKLLPRRNPDVMPSDFSQLASTLIREYELEGDPTLYSRRTGVVEVVIPPRSELIGRTVYPGQVTEDGNVIRGIQRDGTRMGPGDVVLIAGDALLIEASWSTIEHELVDEDVLVVDDPVAVRRQVVPLAMGAKQALIVLAAMIVLLATGTLPPAVAGLLAAIALVMLRVLTIDQAFRSISWTTVCLVAGMMPLSTAMRTTGAADQLADRLVDAVGDAGPIVLVIGLFVLVAVLGQLISNTATALIVIPIAVSSAAELGVSAMPMLMAVNVAASASLLTPVATPANMMVMEPGGYRFDDYWKLGAPLMAWYAVVAIGLVPLIWRF